MDELIERAKFLYYSRCCEDKKQAIEQARKEFPVSGAELRFEYAVYDIDLETYLESII